MDKNKLVALIELTNGHVECLFSQASYLKSHGYNVLVVSQKNNIDRLEHVGLCDESIVYVEDKNLLKSILFFMRLRKVLFDRGVEKVVFNTSFVRMFKVLSFILYPLGIVALVHDVRKLKKTKNKLFSMLRVRKYLALSNALKEKFVDSRSFEIESFYPMWRPEITTSSLEKPSDEFWVCVPGQVEYKRRDYLGLLSSMPENADRDIKFILLGPSHHIHGDGADFKEKVKQKNKESNFIFFDKFVDDELFFEYVEKSDIVLSLISDNEKYTENSISGSYNIAFQFKKPLVLIPKLSTFSDFSHGCFFVENNQVYEFISNLKRNKDTLEGKIQEFSDNECFDFAFQAQQYVDYVLN